MTKIDGVRLRHSMDRDHIVNVADTQHLVIQDCQNIKLIAK